MAGRAKGRAPIMAALAALRASLMIKVYCDTGGFQSELKTMQRDGHIEIHQFKYENRNKNIKSVAPPSSPTWDEMNYTWSELKETGLSWEDLRQQSNKFLDIVRIIGQGKERDAKHLDSAYMAGCSAFLTSDIDDIYSNRVALEQCLGFKVFLSTTNLQEFIEFCGISS